MMGSRRVRGVAPGVVLSLLAVMFTLLPARPASAAIVKQFDQAFSANTNGAILLRGNSSMTCPTSDKNCAGARATTLSGTANNNNSFAMVYTDVDSDASTFNSSSSALPIPTGASVLWAGLYWAGDLQTPSGGTATPNAKAFNTVKLATPKSGYVTVTASETNQSTANSGGATPYQGQADVTSLVAAGGAGTYTVANIQAAQGTDRFAGWALVVAYNDPAAPMRNLTVFDGFGVLQSSDPSVSMTVSGFQTPPSGTVKTQVGAVSYEGDYGYTGDQLQLNGTNLTDAQNPVGNTFNSTVSEDGTLVTGRNPGDRNLFGVDIDRIDASGILANNAKTATLKATTSQDTFYPGVITFATELYAPKLDIGKSVTDVNGGAVEPGDILEYTLAIKNTGQDDAAGVRLLDSIPTNTTYVPGSLKINGAAVTDSATDADVGAYVADSAQGKIRGYLGTGASGTAGGAVAVNATQSVVFRVKINPNVVSDVDIVNVAGADFTGAQTGLGISSASNQVATPVTAPRANLRLTKTADAATVQRGGAASYTLTVINDGPKPATGVVVTDTLPAGATATATSTQGTCSQAGGAISCPVGSMAVGQTVTIKITIADTSTIADPATDSASVTSDQIDPDASNNSATASTALNKPPVAVDDAGSTTTNKAVGIALLGNDSDPDGDTLSVSGVGAAAHGSVVLGAGGTVTYTPAAGYAGTDVFSYTISDGRGGTATAKVTITVANAPPVAVDDAAATAPNTAVDVAVLANDTDPNIPGTAQKLTVTAAGPAAHGTVAVNPDGTVRYTPATGYRGTDTFPYTISDGAGGTATANVTVTVPNAKPVAADDAASTAHATAVAIDVLANDADPNGDKLTVDSFTQPAKGTGTVTAGPGAALTYTPPTGFRGVATFTYVASDGNGGTATATVRVTVANAAPTAAADTASTDTNKAVSIAVLGNDTDPNGDALTITGATDPAHGKAVVSGGAITYTPDPAYKGTDSFTYTVSDGNGGTDTAKVTVTVKNAAPVAKPDERTVAAGTSITIPVIENDTDLNNDALHLASVGTTSKGGTVTRNGDTVVYTPAKDFLGDDTFTYTVTDGDGGTTTGTVTIHVVNTPPNAVDDAASDVAKPNGSITVDVLANDADPNGDKLTIAGYTTGQAAKVEVSGGKLVYTYRPDFAGPDVLTYTVDDGHGGQSTAAVTITVINPAPVPGADNVITTRGTALAIDALVNDKDPNGDAISLATVDKAASGAVVRIVNGKVSYTPPLGFIGTETFGYTVQDARGGVGAGQITVTVNNRSPLAANDTATTDTGQAVTIGVLGNDSDPENDPLTISATTRPTHGDVTVVDGQIVYSPAEGWAGPDAFTYTISDGHGGEATATVVVTVRNAPPVARPDEAGTGPATAVLVTPLDNDTDPNIPATTQALKVTAIGQPAGGKAELSADGRSVTVTPNQGFRGTLTVPYTITDGAGGTANSTITVTVSNAAPVAADDYAETPYLTPVLVPVLTNDNDPNGDPLAIVKTTDPSKGSVDIVNGAVQYTPPNGFSGQTTFTYTVDDGNGGTSVATVTVKVADAPPVAVDDAAETDRQSPVGINVTGNDSDPNSDDLTVTGVVGVNPDAGTAEVKDNKVVFTPNPTFSGTTTFGYVIDDGHGKQASANVTVTVTNKPPKASDDVATTPSGTAVAVPVLGNDSDPDGDALIAAVDRVPAHGAAVVLSDGQIQYTPLDSWAGEDTFTYSVSDGHGGTATATVTVTTGNAPPVAADDQAGTGPNTPVTVRVLGNDTDPNVPGTDQKLTTTQVSDASGGSVEITDDGTSVKYTPDPAFKGVGVFTYTVSDGAGGTATAAVSVRVDNAKPTAVDDHYDIPFQTAMTLPVLANDTDPNHDPLHLTTLGTPLDETGSPRGTVEIRDGKIVYTPPAGFSGQVTFTYGMADDGNGTDTATVVVDVADAPPVAVDDRATTPRDTAVVIDALSNDSDPNGDPLSIISAVGGEPGSALEIVQVGGRTELRYVPSSAYAGTDSVQYTISDGRGGTSTATVLINVPNAAPVFTPAPANTTQAIEVGAPLTALQVTDSDGDHVTVTVRGGDLPPGATFAPDGSFTGTPTARGEYTFTVAACDDRVPPACTTHQVTVVVADQKPDAVDDAAETATGVAVQIPVLANDSDPDGDALTISATTAPAHGEVSVNLDGTIYYTPATGWAGPDSFTYTVDDGHGKTDTATVRVTTRNAAPVAVNDDSGTTLATPVKVPVLANDSDPNIPGSPDQSLRVVSVGAMANGTAVVSPEGTSIEVTPAAKFKGVLEVQYRVDDGVGGTATALVRVVVSDAAPIARDDEGKTPYGTALIVNVLGNDLDPNDDQLSISAVGPVTGPDGKPAGKVEIVDGKVTFTPADKFSGPATFDYTISDGTAQATAHVRIEVADAPPVATPEKASTDRRTPIEISALDGDTDPNDDNIAIAGVGGVDPAAGSVVVDRKGTPDDPSDDVLVFTPNPDFAGETTFYYVVDDGRGGQDSATVTVTVRNTDPNAFDDQATTDTDQPVRIPVLDNDSDPDSDPVTVLSVSDPAHGTVTVGTDGALVYLPAPGWAGSESFGYVISDGRGGTGSATVTVIVANAAPVAVADEAGTGPNTPVTIDVLGNDSDPNIPGTDQHLTITHVDGPDSGGNVDISDGKLVFTPDKGFQGPVTFTYTVSDGKGGTATAQVTVTVSGAAPVASDDTYDIPFQTAMVLPVLSNDTDPNGDALTISSVGKPSAGEVTVGKDGKLTYTPPAGFTGTVSFPYTILDPTGLSSTATVTVVVGDGPPKAVDDTASTGRDKPVAINVLGNDSDANGDKLSLVGTFHAASTDGAPHGTVTVDDHGTPDDPSDDTLVYTPPPGFAGTDTFTYTVDDGRGQQTTATVTVTVSNGAPVFGPEPTNGQQSLVVGGSLVPLTVSDPDGDLVTVTLTGGQLPPGVTLNPDGTFTGTPMAPGSYTFTVQACDDRLPPACTSHEVTVVVAAAPPTGPVTPPITPTNGNPPPTVTPPTKAPPTSGGKVSPVHAKPVPKPKPKPHHSTGLLPHTGAAKVGTLLVFAFALMLLGIAFRVAPSLWPLVAGRRRRSRGTHRKH